MSTKLLLIRHGEIETPKPGCFIGKSDILLSPQGRKQASHLSQVIAKGRPDLCLCSPLKRTLETASLALDFQGPGADCVHPECDSNLREIDFGNWEKKTFAEIESIEPQAVERWAAYTPDFCFPSGESIGDFLVRVYAAAERIVQAARDGAGKIVVFTHGGVIRTLICHFLGLDPRHYLLFNVRPASITTIQIFEDKGILLGLSDVCHLGEDA